MNRVCCYNCITTYCDMRLNTESVCPFELDAIICLKCQRGCTGCFERGFTDE